MSNENPWSRNPIDVACDAASNPDQFHATVHSIEVSIIRAQDSCLQCKELFQRKMAQTGRSHWPNIFNTDALNKKRHQSIR